MGDSLRVRLIGSFGVDGLSERELGSRKGRRLLKALAVAEGAPVRPDALVEVLWPADVPRQPHEQIGVLVSRLRRVLGAECIVRTDAGYALRADWIDVVELRQRTDEAAAALADGRVGAARAAALAALSLVAGELLPDEDGPWVEVARAQLMASTAVARRVAVESAAAAGDHSTVIREAGAALVHDPYDEPITRALMVAHAAAGRPGSALAAYARLRERLVEDLGVSPGPEVEETHTAILLGDFEGDGHAVAPPRGPDLVGREHELARLDRELDEVRGGRSRIVVVEGEPGIGKTALVREWLRRASRTGATIFQSRCDELGRDLPLQPIADALSACVGADAEELGELHASERTLLAETLGVGTVVTDTRPEPETEPVVTRLYAALLHAMAAIAEGGPMVVSIDDLHLAGRSTLEWLAFAVRRSGDVLVVGTARTAASSLLPDATVIPLDPLGVEAVADLVGAERSADLHRRSGGNPLLLTALLEAVDIDDLPVTVRDAAERQVSGLGAAAATTRAAAVLGQRVDLDLVASVVRRPGVDVLSDLERASAAGLMVEDGLGFAFRHELVRDAIVAGVSAARRALLHRDAAHALVRRPGADPAIVAHHARSGGDRTLAAEALRLAAVAAETRHDLGASADYLDAAIGLEDRPELRVARARVRMASLELERAAADAAVAVRSGGGAEALEMAGWIAYYRRRYDDAQTFADEAAAAATDPTARIGALAVGGRVRHGRGDLAGALALLEEVPDGPPQVRAVADVWHAHAQVHAGRPGEALRLVDHALAAGDRMAQPFAPLHGRFARAMALGHLGRLGDAVTAVDDLVDAIERFGAVGQRFVGPAWNVRGWSRRVVGRHGEADEANEEAFRVTGGQGGPSSDGMAEAHWVARLDLTDAALFHGDLDRAMALLDGLGDLETWTGTMAWHQRHRLGVLRARAALADGDRDEARELASAVAADALGRGAHRYAAIADAVALAAGAPGEDRVGEVLDALDRCAGAESWWLTASIAATLESSGIRARAEDRAERLLLSAGPHAASFRRWVDSVLG